MYRLARFSVKFPTTIIMAILAILLLGYISFQRLGMDLLPRLNSPRLYVELEAGEKPPEEIEEQYVSQLEATAARGRNVTSVSSVSRVGQALITVEYDWNTDMDEAFLELQKAVGDFSQNKSDIDEISVSQLDPNAQPIVQAVLWHEEIEDLDRLRQTAENNIRNELIRLPGVAAVELVGERRREIEVKTDAFTLESYGLTVDQISSAITSSNQSISGGSIVEMGLSYIIRGVGELASIEELRELIIAYKIEESPTGEEEIRTPIRVREVAKVDYVLSPAENIVRYNGRRCVALEIFKEAQYNTTEASKSIHEQLDTLRRALPGFEIRVVLDQAGFIQSAVTEVGQTGLIGILLAVIILFVFLRRIGVTAVISIAIPISVVATFNLMYFNHLTLNIMTLGGLALGAGMLVDNAIVVVENIFRHLEEGKSLREAAIQGAGEVGGAITSATLTTIIVFLPIVYLHGISGELFKEQAWTVAFSLISSLFVALSVIPMLSSRLLKPRSKEKKVIQSIQFPFYGRVLETILKRKWFVVFGAAVLVTVTVLLLPMVGSEFMPQSERSEMMINLQLPEGSSLDRTDGAVRSLESLIQENFGDHIEHIVTRVGPSGTALNEYEALAGENTALIHVSLKSDSNIRIQDLMEWTDRQLNDLPGIRAQIFQEQTTLQTTLGTNKAPFVVEIKGKELDTLNSLAEEVRTLLHEIPELLNIETSFQEGRPEINIEVDRTTASLFGLTPESIGSQLKDLLSGRDVGEYQDEGEFINIVLTTPEPTLDQLEGLLLDAQDGQKIRMDEVTRMVRTTSPREIIRNNQVRTAEVRTHMSGSLPFDQIAQKVETSLDTLTLPPDYSFEITGEEMLRKESFQSLSFALLLAVILVYMVMAAQFESLRYPFVILLTIPLAGVGAVFLLLILGMPFNIMSFLGIIMLTGIAVNDSIILVDLINQLRRSGQDIDSAILTAGRLRIRPIFMTSTTTILALLPLTIGIGEGAALRAPLAVAVIGGLITSTLLTLGVIPAVYRIFSGRIKTKQRS